MDDWYLTFRFPIGITGQDAYTTFQIQDRSNLLLYNDTRIFLYVVFILIERNTFIFYSNAFTDLAFHDGAPHSFVHKA